MIEESIEHLSLKQILGLCASLDEQECGESVPFVDASPLREMQKKILSYIVNDSNQKIEKIAAYVIYHVIEDIFYNLSGDVLINPAISKAQYDYLNQFTNKCQNIRIGLGKNDLNAVYSGLEELIAGFFQTVRIIDNQVE